MSWSTGEFEPVFPLQTCCITLSVFRVTISACVRAAYNAGIVSFEGVLALNFVNCVTS